MIKVVVIIAAIEMFRFVAGSKKSTRGVGDSGGGTAACDFLQVAKSLPAGWAWSGGRDVVE